MRRIPRRAAITVAAGALAVTASMLTAPAVGAALAPPPPPGPSCPDVYAPGVATFSDGSTGTFNNRCWAHVYAGRHGLTVVKWVEGV